MRLEELMDVNKLEQYIEDGYVSKRKHPTLPLYILNYTAATQFAWVWDEITLNCRGLVIDEDYNVVARSFPKFFSYEQLAGKLPEGEFVVEEKMDGSMLIVFYYKGQLVTATRGSFESEQAVKALEFLPKNLKKFKEGEAWIFEIIYPENRIVVEYNFAGVVLLGITYTWKTEHTAEYVDAVAAQYNFLRPKVYSFTSLEEILKYEEPNLEGFVLRYKGGERVKSKLEEYKRLHKLMTGFNEKDVWEALKSGTLNKVLEEVPDEMYEFVKETEKKIMANFDKIKSIVEEEFIDKGNRKDNALHYATCKYPSLLFAKLDGKNYEENIWPMVKPKAVNTFKVISEDYN